MHSVTDGKAKESLLLAGKPVLHWVLEEAAEAGASELVVVTSVLKPEIEELVLSFPKRNLIRMVAQEEPKGLADAIACAGSKFDALVLLPDALFVPRSNHSGPNSPSSAIAELASARSPGAILGFQVVPDDLRSRFGIVELEVGSQALRSVTRVVEKPKREETESNLAIAGRYFFSRESLGKLAKIVASHPQNDRQREPSSKSREMNLDPLFSHLASEHELFGVSLEAFGTRLDCGSPEGFAEAQKAFSHSPRAAEADEYQNQPL